MHASTAFVRCALPLTVMVSVGGCQTVELLKLAAQEQQYRNDRQLEAKIRGALLADPLLRHAAIDVDVFLMQVVLHGDVSETQRARALALAGRFGEAARIDSRPGPATALVRIADDGDDIDGAF